MATRGAFVLIVDVLFSSGRPLWCSTGWIFVLELDVCFGDCRKLLFVTLVGRAPGFRRRRCPVTATELVDVLP